MIRNILLFLIILFVTQSIWGQDKMPSIGVLELDAATLTKEKAVKINKYVESAFYKSKRFNIVTRQLQDAINQEREDQKNNMDVVIQQGKAIGADYIVKGFAKKYTQAVHKSSPKSRDPYGGRYITRTTSKPKPSPTTTESKPATKTASNQKIKTKKKLSSKTSPRTSSDSKSKTKSSTVSKSKIPTKSSSRSPAKTTVKEKSKTSSKKETASKSKTPTRSAASPSAEIDQVYTSTQISFTLKIMDVKTGVVVAEKTYTGSINGVAGFVKGLVIATFPYEFNILEIMEMSGNKKAKHLLVDGGFKHGLKKWSYLQVFEVTEEEVEGKLLKREVQIGHLRVNRLDTGGHFSLCKIKKGKKKILEKMNKKAKLVCKELIM